MIKELFLAIIMGALLGFGITGGFFALNKTKGTSANNPPAIITSTTDTNTDNNIQSDNPTPTIASNNETTDNGSILISSPEDESVVSNSKTTVNGTTTPKSMVIITTPTNSYSTTSDQNGDFSTPIELESGANQITITSINNEDVQVETKISVTYSTAKI